MPNNVRVHGSVIRRMRQDETYRPGNLIVGGGGRGCRVAPKEYGMGEWVCVQNEGDPVGEIWVRQGHENGAQGEVVHLVMMDSRLHNFRRSMASSQLRIRAMSRIKFRFGLLRLFIRAYPMLDATRRRILYRASEEATCFHFLAVAISLSFLPS